jgi:hypothetical protein
MDKEMVSYQLLRAGLIAKAQEATPSEDVARVLNEWASLVEVGITFFYQDGEIIWSYN